MRKILVSEIELPSCEHLRYIWFTLPDVIVEGGYVATISYDAFFHGVRGRNWRPSRYHPKRDRLYVAHRPDEIYDHTVTPGVPHEEVATLWDFYTLIGYDYKKKKYTGYPKKTLTKYQAFTLGYLNDKMEANARMIGEHLIKSFGGSSPTAIAAPVIGSLYRSGYLTHIRELKAWRITGIGRKALQASITERGSKILDELTAEAQELGLY